MQGLAGALLVGVAFACAPRDDARNPNGLGPVATLKVAGADNRGASLAASGNRVVAAWAGSIGDVTNIYAAVSEDGGLTFERPVRVNDVEGDARVNGEQPPRVAVGKDIVVSWQSRRTGVSQVRLARSIDGGRTFTVATTIHDASLTGTRGWSSVVLDADGAAHIAWLDGRNAKTPAAAGGHAHSEPMRQDIFQAVFRPDGTHQEAPVATNVCFCCKTSVATGSNGVVYVAWRHIYPTNLRDMAVAASTDDGKTFGPPTRVSQDGWQIEGCPEDGPSIAVDDAGAVHIVWPTLADVKSDNQRKGIFYSVSKDGGQTFEPRTRIDEGDAKNAAHPQLSIDAGGPIVVWDESGPAGPRIRARRVGQPAITAFEGEPATYPAVAATSDGLVAAWTASTAGASEIRLRKLHIGRVP